MYFIEKLLKNEKPLCNICSSPGTINCSVTRDTMTIKVSINIMSFLIKTI
jgi:hypothetical protein